MGEGNSVIFRISYSMNAMIVGIAIALLLCIPLVSVLFLGSQGPTFFLVFMVALLILLPSLIVHVTLAGRSMSYEVTKDEFRVNYRLMNLRAPYSSIQDVEMVELALLLRLFGGSWPGFHWGLFKTSRGVAHVYSTKMKGTFILITLVDGRKIAITPAEPQAFMVRINEERSKFGTATEEDIELTASCSWRLVYAQMAGVAGAFMVFLAYFLAVFPSLPEIVPVHFNFNWVPDRWAPKSELFIMVGLAALFPVLNGALALKFGRYEKSLLVFLGVVFFLVEMLFLSILYTIQGFV